MDENIGSAGPALAAHSKDASAKGQTAASETGAKQSAGSLFQAAEEVACDAMGGVSDFVRQQPIVAAAMIGAIGVAFGMLLSRR